MAARSAEFMEGVATIEGCTIESVQDVGLDGVRLNLSYPGVEKPEWVEIAAVEWEGLPVLRVAWPVSVVEKAIDCPEPSPQRGGGSA